MAITRESIEERKTAIQNDIVSTRQRLVENDKKKTEDTALLNALAGAIQQCDIFLRELDNEEPAKVTDGEVPIVDNPYGGDDGNDAN